MKLSELQSMLGKLPAGMDPKDYARRNELLRVMGLEPGTLYQELEMTSRFVDTHRDTSYANSHVNLHSHSFYELLYCRNTCGAEYLVGSDRYSLRSGDIILIAPGVSHRPMLPEYMAEPYCRDVLWISTEFMEHLQGVFQLTVPQKNYSSLLRTAGTRWEFLGELFQAGVREAEEREPGWEMAVVGNTVNILSFLTRALLDRNTHPMKAEKPELLDRIIAYVSANLEEKITLSEVARQFYVSESTISQLFRKKMDVSFYRYVTQRRLIAAKTFIEEGMQLEEVSRKCGFADYSVFYRAFRQQFGISPRQYRTRQDTKSSASL